MCVCVCVCVTMIKRHALRGCFFGETIGQRLENQEETLAASPPPPNPGWPLCEPLPSGDQGNQICSGWVKRSTADFLIRAEGNERHLISR